MTLMVPAAYSHHEQHGGDDQPWVGRVAEQRPEEGGQVQVDGLHDHVKHLGLPTKRRPCVGECLLLVLTSCLDTNVLKKGGSKGFRSTLCRLATIETLLLKFPS